MARLKWIGGIVHLPRIVKRVVGRPSHYVFQEDREQGGGGVKMSLVAK